MQTFLIHYVRGRLPRLILGSVVTGVIVGLIVAGYDYLIIDVMLEELVERPLWIQAIAPTVGLIGAAFVLYFVGRGASSSTSDEYVHAFHERHARIPIRELPAKLLAGVSTIGFGGALGLEGPAIYTGASVGLNLQTWLGRFYTRDETKMLLTAGAAAGVAAIFKTPATGVIFALEAPYRDDVARRALLPSLFASASSYLVFVAILGTEPVISVTRVNVDLGIEDLLGGALVGLAAGLGGAGFAVLVQAAKHFPDRYPVWIRTLVGGALLAGFAFAAETAFDTPLTLGPGVRATDWVLQTDPSIGLIAAAFGIRAAATLTTLGAGGLGGVFIPLAVQGVLMGAFIGDVIGEQDEIGLYPTLGLAAFLAAGYRTPIAAVMFVAETTGTAEFVVPALIAAAVSQLVAGNASVASYQRSVRLGHLERRFTLPITSALTTDVLTVPPDATVSEFVYLHVLGRREREVPVVEGGTYLGICGLDQMSEIDRAEWETTEVRDIMRSDIPPASPAWSLRDAVATMEDADVDLLPVANADGTFVGVVYGDDILKLDEILDETGG